MPTNRSNATHEELVLGSFPDRASADRAYDDLIQRGYSPGEINVIMSDATRQRHFPESESRPTQQRESKAAEGGLTGATVGGAVGAIAGVLTVAGTLAIPGLGIVLAGPVAAALAGLGAGAATGGVVGLLIGAGIPEERARRYERDLDEGGIVIGVTPRSAEDAAFFEETWADNLGRIR